MLGRIRRQFDRGMLRRLGLAMVSGLLVGVALHILDSAPENVAFLGTLIRVVLGFGLVLGAIVGLGRMVMLGEPALVLGCLVLLVSALLAYPIGPTWIPAERVSGTYTLAVGNVGMSPTKGDLVCTWLPGRWRIGDFAATAPLVVPGDETVLLQASLTLPQVRLDRSSSDGRPRAPYVSATSNVLEPLLLDTGLPARTADGRSGQASLDLVIDTSSPPVGGLAGWTAPMLGDVGGTARVEITWSCAGP